MVRKPSLLIVDDEPNILLTMRLVFQESGYAVTTAESEAEALQGLRKGGKFDAILTDMSMKRDQSGMEVANVAAQLRPRPVIIIFTGYGENLRGAIGTAVDYFATKPLDIDDLKSTLQRLLALRRDRFAARGGR